MKAPKGAALGDIILLDLDAIVKGGSYDLYILINLGTYSQFWMISLSDNPKKTDLSKGPEFASCTSFIPPSISLNHSKIVGT